MKIMKNKKLCFLVLIIAALATNLIVTGKTSKSETVFEFFGGLSKAAVRSKERQPKENAPKANSAPTATPAPTENPTEASGNATKEAANNKDNKNETLKEWFYISSPEFRDKFRYPHIPLRNCTKIKINFDYNEYRINPQYKEDSTDDNNPPTPASFWFRLSGTHLYYSCSKTEINLAGAISIESIEKVDKLESYVLFCLMIEDKTQTGYIICSENQEIRDKWWIQININLGIDVSQFLPPKEFESNLDLSKFEKFEIEQKVIQPIIMIPLPRRKCNDKWNYANHGNDWECICKEGLEQSPIDLPHPIKAIDSSVTPFFKYDTVKFNDHVASLDGLVSSKEMHLRYFSNAVRLLYPNLGKVVTLDESVYVAEEILFHTPSEHTLNGKRYDMEMQILHYGRSEGDIAKQVVVSFLFKKSPGAFVKFFESFDVFRLPNALFKKTEIVEDLDINKLFYDIDYEGEITIKPFSFFTYQGSLTFPPCTERTIHYVASQPIALGEIIIDHFREAIGEPRIINDNNYDFDDKIENYRDTQPINGRDIFHWDHVKNCPKNTLPEIEEQAKGHYEKISSKVWHYYYINTPEPSGLYGATAISEQEAKNIPPPKKEDQ
jgi:carbonic anhydrase